MLRHWPSCSRPRLVLVGLIASSFLLILLVRRHVGSSGNDDYRFQIAAPYFAAADDGGSTYSLDSVYEAELMSILKKAEAIGDHDLIITNTDDEECSERNFSKSFSRCFRDGTVQCGKRYLLEDPKERIKDILSNQNLRVAPQYQQVLKEMASKVEGQYELIIVSALSSNHYAESQLMLQELHRKIFPLLSSYLLVVYDIGLTSEEHLEYQKHCRCKLLKFPFEAFPEFVKKLKCFGWKPAVIRAHFDNAKFVMWMDASVRYHDPKGFIRAIELTQTYGVQQHRSKVFVPNPLRVIPTAFLFFGDSPCAHMPYTQAESNWGIYRSSPLIKDLVLGTWLACGLNRSCTCPAFPDLKLTCEPLRKVKTKYGMCMRPQFAIGVILAKLYVEHYNVAVDKGVHFMKILRRTRVNYFDKLHRELNSTNNDAR